MSILEIKSVTVSYKKRVGIKNASFKANRGEIIGFIGADGAGKSSLMHAISGVIHFDGEIIYNFVKYKSPKESERVKKYIGFMPQGIGLVLYDELTVDEHLNFFADIRNIKKDSSFYTYKEKLLEMAGLSRFVNREAGKLSGGMMQKLSLICTLLHRPKLLILDEPTTGVDPLSRLELWEILNIIRKEENSLIIVSTAYMQEASKMDRLFLFDDGEIIAQGRDKELTESIAPFVYKEESYEKSSEILSFNKKIYSLNHLNIPKAKPTLEDLFFVNALKKDKKPPKIEIKSREQKIDIPNIVMSARGITKKFGKFIANDHIDIELKQGEILGLLGANGAGKTTLIKMLLGLYPIDNGELKILNQYIKNGKDRQNLKSYIGYVSQHFALYNDMTILENLLYFSNMHHLKFDTAMSRITNYAKELGFEKYLNEFPTSLPLGVNQRFSIAAALLHEPVILFLDEPTSGVDPIARAQFWEILKELKERWNISILITTHYMSEAEYCDRVVLLKDGRKIADDLVSNLYLSHPKAKNFEEIFLSFYKKHS